MVISGVNILAHAALSRMGLLAHRSPRAQQPWQMPTSLCDGLKRRCSHELPAARPFAASPAPHPSIRPSVSHQSGRSSVTKFGRLPARRSVSPAVRQSGCPLARKIDRPLARQPDRHACSQVLPSFGPTTHQPVRPAVRPSVLPSVGPPIQSPTHPVSRPLGRQPAHPSAHLSGCAISIDGLSATDAGLRRSHLSDRLADVARRLRRTQDFTASAFPKVPPLMRIPAVDERKRTVRRYACRAALPPSWGVRLLQK